jgi:glutamate/tyrosine decarboxylase-like PLP-dependent enzyme
MRPLELSTEEFRRLATEVVELSAQYLASLDARSTFPTTSGMDAEALFSTQLPEKPMSAAALAGLREFLDHGRAQNGRFYGYVLSPGEPVAALGDLVASIANQNMTAWRSSPSGITIERTVVRWLAEAIGCGSYMGTLTGGGSAANLMGLAMAREAKLNANERGLWEIPRAVIYASEQVHMAVPKAVAMLGLGRQQLRYVGVDESFRMRPSDLEQTIREDLARGRKPIAIVASAGTVNTGAVDPLREIATIASEHGLWLHVDGAYGALAAIAARDKFDGLGMVDSLSLDPHKWLYQPLDCGCLLYRDTSVARQTFAYTGTYAKQLSDDPIEGFVYFEESMELSRRCRGLKLWLSLRFHGLDAFRAAIRQDLDHAQRLAQLVDATPHLERLAPVELSAVCFRHRLRENASEAERNAFNLALLKRLIARGRVYLSNTELHGKFCLRACIVNHLATDADIEAVIEDVVEVGKQILA